MSKHRPFKKGSLVTHTPSDQPAIVEEVLSDAGRIHLRFADGVLKTVSRAMVVRRRRSYPQRKKRAASEVEEVQFTYQLREVVKRRMDRLGLTVEELSNRSGLSRSSLHRIMHDDDRGQLVETIETLASALEISPRDFWTTAQKV